MAEQVRIVAEALDSHTEQVVAALSSNVAAELIERTPVDTGWARANWVPAVGGPAGGGPTPSNREDRQRAAAGARAAQQTATAALLGYRIEQGAVFISNNVPYIGRLNAGTSDQAPEGFVQDAIVAAINSLRGAAF